MNTPHKTQTVSERLTMLARNPIPSCMALREIANDVRALEAERDALRVTYSNKQYWIGELEAQKNDRDSKIQALEAEMQKLREDNDRLRDNLESFTKSIQSAASEVGVDLPALTQQAKGKEKA